MLAALVLPTFAGCGGATGTDSPGPPSRVVANAPQAVEGFAGVVASSAPSVVVEDASGRPVPGVAVSFSIVSGGGSLRTTSAMTSDNGVASAGEWTLGTAAGQQVARATAAGLSAVDFTAAVKPGPAERIVIYDGDGQTAVVTHATPIPPAVMVVDRYGNPVAGPVVRFTPMTGGGSVMVQDADADAQGIARVLRWNLGNTVGENTLRATLLARDFSVTFTAAAIADAPARLLVDAGNDQSGRVGEVLPIAPRVRLTDQFFNPLPGRAITFALLDDRGSITGASATTDADGYASVGSWTLDTLIGPQRLRASYSGSGVELSDDITAIGYPDYPAHLELVSGPQGQFPVASIVSPSPVVRLTDSYGNPIENFLLTFVASDYGTVAAVYAPTSSDGVVTAPQWRLGPYAGTQSLTISATNSLLVTVSLEAVAAAP